MSQTLNLKIKGRFTSFNELSEVPEGALLEADDIDIIQDSVAQPRRGFDRETGSYSDTANRTDALVEFESHKIAHHGTLGSANKLSYLSSGTWTNLETVSAISSRKMKFVGANQNLYYTTSTGIRCLEAYNGTPRMSGGYKALDITSSTSASGSTWLVNGASVAYRAVWLYRDSNDNLIFGAPSQREVYTNSSGVTKAVDLVVTIPAGVTTSWFVQIYRSASITGTPNDELGLVYEAHPTAGEITAKSMTITDIVPDSLRGATIYTAASQEGLAAQNEIAPLAEDIAVFRDCVFFGKTTSKHRFYLTLISVGASLGVQNNDTITVGGVTYTGKATETASSGEFAVVTGGSAAQNIADTARSLVRVINRYSSSTVYAYYLSGADDLPGKILLEERSLGGAAFVITTSRATCWNPTDIPSSGTTKTSSNDSFSNGLFWSKPNQPEAVPLVNFASIGSKNDTILRIKALRDALYIFKESGEVYKLTGYYPNFQVDKIEDSVKLIARESLQVLNNQLFGLSDQGVVVISDSTKVISRPIEQELLELVNQNYSLVQSIAFGLAYESDRKYYLFLPSESSDTYPTQAHVYNIFTNTWVRHTVPASCALVDASNNFYLGSPTTSYLLKERKNYSYLDYADFGFEDTITSISGTDIMINAGFDNVDVGDVLFQSANLFVTVAAVDPATQTITIDVDPGLSLGAVTVLKGIATRIVWAPATFANPGIQKQIHTATLMFKSDFVGTARLGFFSDLDQAEDFVSIEGRGLGLWGLFPWGEEPWGGDPIKRPLRQWVPRAKQRASQLTISFNHTWGFSSWQLVGISLFGELGSEDTGRT